jgi:hypothetical protein
LRSPGVASLDATLQKSFKLKPLGEGGALEFRSEFYNLLNRPNFALPVSSSLTLFDRNGVPNPTAGQITATRDTASAPSRQIQFAVRIVF